MGSILVIEDRPADRTLLASVLRSGDHHVLIASDGAEAIEMLQHLRADLVITRILTRRVDGHELLRRLCEIPGVQPPPVVFYTAAHQEREARALARRCGVSALLRRPSTPAVILRTVRHLLEPDDSRQDAAADMLGGDPPPDTGAEDADVSASRMSALVELSQQISGERDPAALLRHACASARDITLAQRAIVGVLDGDGATAGAVESGLAADSAGIAPGAEPLWRVAVRERRAMRLVNPGGRPEALGFSSEEGAVHSFLSVPVASANRVYGYLALWNKLGAEEFSEPDEEVVHTLGALAAVGYENARLYEDLRKNVAALQREVRERRRVEDRLRENEDRTRFALGTVRMAIWELDLVQQQILSAEMLGPLFGMDTDRTLPDADALLALVHPDDRGMLLQEIQRSVTLRRDYSVTFRVRWPDGSLHWIDARGHLLNDETGAPVRMVGVSVDVSDRTALEEQLLQAQKMEGIGQLAGGVAHDFNNLLTAILGYAALIEDSLEPADPRRQDVQEIVKATDRASAMTRQLLAFSRKQLLEPTIVDLNTLILEMSHMLIRLISEDIDLRTVLPPALSPVRADAGQLQQVVMNLAVNARDAMPTGGTLTIETADVQLDSDYLLQHAVAQAGRYVMVAVSDTGHGITDAVKARLFEPFFTTKGKGRGTGLGLATVYGIVQQSGGYIWVYSEPGQGATFKVYLPAADEEADAAAVRTETPAARGRELVAIVEDEEAVRRLASVVLSRAGYRVLEAPDPLHAEALIADHTAPIDLLVTDVIMPGASGPSLYQRLVGRQPTLRVLYMSGYTDDAVIRQGRLQPGEAFLAKPFTGERLLRKVREVLDR